VPELRSALCELLPVLGRRFPPVGFLLWRSRAPAAIGRMARTSPSALGTQATGAIVNGPRPLLLPTGLSTRHSARPACSRRAASDPTITVRTHDTWGLEACQRNLIEATMDFSQKDDGLDPNRLVETRWLAYRWGFDGTRRLEDALRRLGVPLLPIGKGVTLIRIRDIWDRCDDR